jgi:hypothetical protein
VEVIESLVQGLNPASRLLGGGPPTPVGKPAAEGGGALRIGFEGLERSGRGRTGSRLDDAGLAGGIFSSVLDPAGELLWRGWAVGEALAQDGQEGGSPWRGVRGLVGLVGVDGVEVERAPRVGGELTAEDVGEVLAEMTHRRLADPVEFAQKA